MPDSNPKKLPLIDAIYASALDSGRWMDFLDQVTRTLSGFSTIYRWQHASPHDNQPLFHNFGDFGQSYIDHFQSRNVWVTGSKATARTSAVLSSEQIVPIEELERTEFYADWMRPQKLKHGISCLLHAGQQYSYHLGIIRGPEFGAFAEAEQQLLSDLLPHMARSFELGRTMEALQRNVHALHSAFDGLGVGVLLVDARAKIHFANPIAERMLREEPVLRAAGGCFGASLPAANARVRAAIADATGDARRSSGRTGATLALARRGRPPLSLNIAPLAEQDRCIFGAGPLALAILSDGDRPVRLDIAALRSFFDLTPAEARLAAAVAAGTSLLDHAAAAGVGLATVKTHLAAIFRKTGTNRQADLVRLMAAYPGLQRTEIARESSHPSMRRLG
ncbi:helix-turn-helix transcriptional regulator [Sphingomonas sp. NPDC092331]|uniref:helix-turn-helix transcriptional regulator n=1 Tax=unclassified Sphingomonas TaxID=196159 RepID=UPI0031F49A8F